MKFRANREKNYAMHFLCFNVVLQFVTKQRTHLLAIFYFVMRLILYLSSILNFVVRTFC